jgi:hypothetical protein
MLSRIFRNYHKIILSQCRVSNSSQFTNKFIVRAQPSQTWRSRELLDSAFCLTRRISDMFLQIESLLFDCKLIIENCKLVNNEPVKGNRGQLWCLDTHCE